MTFKTDSKNDIRFISVDWCRAPKCDTCDSEMKTVSKQDWGCQDESCEQYKKPIHVGVYGIYEPEVSDP